jgi:signal transduction histidine kinase/DNA-binding response OmpR family regulator
MPDLPQEEKLNILLVDDRPENLVALESVLGELGQNLVRAESGREALRKLLDMEFAVILLDVQMPEMDGFETAALIRARRRNEHTPIVFLTAINKSVNHVTRGYSVGAVDYVFKPFDPDVLRAKVSAFVDLARKTHELRREIEQRKQAEAEVRQLTEDLERRVQERTAELHAVNKSLQGEIKERQRAEEERTQLLEAEQLARHQAEEAQRDLAFLGEASSVLAGSLDYQTTLERVAELAVPRVADFCVVDLVDGDGRVHRVVTAHRDPKMRRMMRVLERTYKPTADDGKPMDRAIRDARPELVERVTDEWLVASARDEEHLKIARKLAPTSIMVVPLIARGHAFGVITLALVQPQRRYTHSDLALAEDLARRAAAAIDNARLFREVQDAGRTKDEFLAMLAHELRNPLAAISSAIFAINQSGSADPRTAHFRSVVERQTLHLSRLVDDLLDVSRITQGKIELRRQKVDLKAVIHQALDATRPLIEARDHHLRVELPDEPMYLHADPTRLEQVLANLLNNAAKYTEPGGYISLTADIRDGEAWVCVRDSGVGISPELLPRVFELFTQSDRTLDRSQGGLGIGLALVRNLIQLHGGDVTAYSQGPGTGSEFAIRLPLQHQSTRSEGEERRLKAHRRLTGNPHRILIVEDNRDAAETLCEILEAWNYEVRTASDGPSGLQAARDFHPDVVLLDIGLPLMDGYQVARTLRDEGDDETLLVALTGYGHEEDRRRSREAGFDLHLTKPVSPPDLRELLTGTANVPA